MTGVSQGFVWCFEDDVFQFQGSLQECSLRLLQRLNPAVLVLPT